MAHPDPTVSSVASPTAIVYAPDEAPLPELLLGWAAEQGLTLVPADSADEVMRRTLRARPRCVILDGRGPREPVLATCRRLKGDSFTGIIPVLVIDAADPARVAESLEAGADEVITDGQPPLELRARLAVLLRRSDRDANVHPSTRLPGTVEIEREIARRLETDELFAVCYADLDHFKEFNDRYSYFDGDRVIKLLAKILHDVVKGLCGEDGFVGHIGGDDFIFIIPAKALAETCQEIVWIFDQLIPYQYSEQDRRAGYFFGKDRRGQLHRVPLMTVSIGVVTNERRRFTHAAQVSELATEMKSYAKTLSGSIFTVDRRQDPVEDGDESSLDRNPLGMRETT